MKLEGKLSSESKAKDGRLLAQQMLRYGLGIGGPAIISSISTAVFTRLFDVTAYGLFTVALATISVAASFAGQWLQQPLGRFMAEASKREAAGLLRAAWFGLGMLTILILIVATVIPQVYPLAGTPYGKFWLPGVLFFLLQLYLSCATVVLQARMEAGLYSRQQVTLALARFIISLLLVWLIAHDSAMLLWGSVLAILLVLPTALQRSGLHQELIRPSQPTESAWLILRKMSRYGIPMTGWFVATNALSSCDRILIGMYRGSGEAGIYGANYNLMTGTVGLVTAPVLAATWPFLMRAWSTGNSKEAGTWLGKIASGVLAGGVLLSSVTALLATDVAALVLGPAFREGAMVMPPVVAGMVALSVANYANKPFEFHQKIGRMVFLGLVIAILNVVLNVSLVPRYGYMASAWITLFCYVLYALCSTIMGRRLLPWRWDWKLIVLTVLGGLLGYYLGRISLNVIGERPSILRILMGFVVFGATAFVVLASAYYKELKIVLMSQINGR